MRISEEYLNSSQIPPGARMTQSVEQCDCPREFAGDSCERCAEGFTRRVPNSGPYAIDSSCVVCNCHGNSDRCDPATGVCIDCKHNTTGWCPELPFSYHLFHHTIIISTTNLGNNRGLSLSSSFINFS